MKPALAIIGAFIAINAFLAFTDWLSETAAADFISLAVIGGFVAYGISIIVKDLRNAR